MAKFIIVTTLFQIYISAKEIHCSSVHLTASWKISLYEYNEKTGRQVLITRLTDAYRGNVVVSGYSMRVSVSPLSSQCHTQWSRQWARRRRRRAGT